MIERTKEELGDIEELVSKVESAVKSLDLDRRLMHLDERYHVHLLTIKRYTTLFSLNGEITSFNPNGNQYPFNDVVLFMNKEIESPFCWGFVPLTEETKGLLIRLGRNLTVSGDIIVPWGYSFDIYT